MLDYLLIEKQALERNILDLRRKIESGIIPDDTIIKLERFSEKFNLDIDFLKDHLLRDDLFILHFMKDPLKQSMHETVCFNHLKSFPWVLNAENLPSGGSNAYYVVNGLVVRGSELTNKNPSKSVDFKWQIQNPRGQIIDCYATHKFTKGAGGGQDNQFKDVESFFSNAAQYSENDKLFFAILDGQYYQTPYKGSTNRIHYLNDNYKTRNNSVFALTINELEDGVIEI